jgi:SH3 domain protein
MPCAVLLLVFASAPLSAQDSLRYVSDEIAIVLRDAPRAEGASRGVVMSGARVSVLGAEEAGGYVRVRTADNREGWMLARYLKREPIARERVRRLEQELAAAQAELKKTQDEHAKLLQDFARITGGQPIASSEVMAEADALRAQLKQKELDVADARKGYDAERASQQTLLLGGLLVAGGFMLALLLRWLWPKRRWGDF